MSIFSTDQSHIKDVSCYMWLCIDIHIEDRGCTHVWRTKKEQSLTILEEEKVGFI
jgi:hypothetical protein